MGISTRPRQNPPALQATKFPNPSKFVYSAKRPTVFSTLFSVFGNVVKHCLSCLIDTSRLFIWLSYLEMLGFKTEQYFCSLDFCVAYLISKATSTVYLVSSFPSNIYSFCSWMSNIHELRGPSGVSRWRSLTHSLTPV